jgi:hypothetical protein
MTDLPVQPGLGCLPVLHHRHRRHIQYFSRHFNAQPAEDSQLDNTALPMIDTRKSLQGIDADR